jgi:apolipoprotein N-acyltransferase
MQRVLAGLACAVLAGVMFAVAMPPRSVAILGWVFLVPLILSLRGTRFIYGFVAGLVAAFSAAFVSTTPLVAPNVISGDVSWNYVGFGLYGVVLAVMMGVAAEHKSMTFGRAAVLACLGVVLECLTFIKLPAHLALMQYASSPAMALASVTGIWGVSWVMWFSNFALASDRDQKGWRFVAPAIAGLALLCSVVFWRSGGSVLGQDRVVAAVQTDQFGADEILPLNQDLIGKGVEVGVWPELSVGEYDVAAIRKFSGSDGGYPVVVSMHDDFSPKPHNMAVLIDKDGIRGRYFKRKPFGSEENEVTAGTRPVVVQTLSQNVGLNVCFDSCYPAVMRDTANAGDPDLIALPTLDPASPNGFIQAAHAAFTPFRAAELGVPIVRAEATAHSMLVNGDGGIVETLPAGFEGGVSKSVGVKRWTVYRKLGDWFLWVCVGVLVGAVCGKSHRVRS